MNEAVVFDCEVSKKLFEKNGFYIYAVKVDKTKFPDIAVDTSYKTARIMGNNLYELENSRTYSVTATPKENVKYGISYEVVSIVTEEPKTESDIRLFLQTILTQNQAEQLIKHYPNIIQLVKEERTDEIDFSKLKGITPKRFENIKTKIANNFQMLDICAAFYNLISMPIMQKLFNRFGSVGKIKEALKTNPYTSLYSLDGIGFIKADAILLQIEEQTDKMIKNGEEPRFQFNHSLKDSMDRCLACMGYFIGQNENDGNTKMSIEDLKGKVVAYAREASIYFNSLLQDEVFHVDIVDGMIGLEKTYQLEQYVADKILAANKKPILWDFNLEKYSKVGEFVLTEEQKTVQKLICKNNVVVLNGPSGSGKSSSVEAVVNMLNDHGLNFLMSAPSAKAAKVLMKYAGFPATTIHRMLGYENGGFVHNEENPLRADLVIIDETSMMDIFLFQSVLKAIDFNRTKLLLIGDSYQLPSVGAGNLLQDIISSNACPISVLTKIFRYSENGLVTVATDTRNGKPFLPYKISSNVNVVPFSNSFFFCPQSNERCVDYAVKMYKKLSEVNHIEDIIVLTAQNKGPQGTIEVNNRIQNVINPKKDDENVLRLDKSDFSIEYRKDDIVMQTSNDYHSIVTDEFGYYEKDEDGKPLHEVLIANGETGRVCYIDKEKMVVRFDNHYILRRKADLEKLSLGYVLSVHKSQGSGYKNVIVITPSTHTYMLNSNLLYVGFTRSKEKCFCIGSLMTVNSSVKKKANLSRKTFLQDIIKKMREIDTKE